MTTRDNQPPVVLTVSKRVKSLRQIEKELKAGLDGRAFGRRVIIDWGGVRWPPYVVVHAVKVVAPFRPSDILFSNLKGDAGKTPQVNAALRTAGLGQPLSPAQVESMGIDLADSTSRSAGEWTSLGGFGWAPPVSTKCLLALSSSGITLVPDDGSRTVLWWRDLTGIEVGGPGTTTSGGGFFGGGFGLDGAALGIAAAALLNDLTTTTQTNTLVRISGEGGEVTLHTSLLTPDEARIEFGEAIARIKFSQAQGPANTDPVERLERLQRLKDSGAVSDEEFHLLRQKIFDDIG